MLAGHRQVSGDNCVTIFTATAVRTGQQRSAPTVTGPAIATRPAMPSTAQSSEQLANYQQRDPIWRRSPQGRDHATACAVELIRRGRRSQQLWPGQKMLHCQTACRRATSHVSTPGQPLSHGTWCCWARCAECLAHARNQVYPKPCLMPPCTRGQRPQQLQAGLIIRGRGVADLHGRSAPDRQV